MGVTDLITSRPYINQQVIPASVQIYNTCNRFSFVGVHRARRDRIELLIGNILWKTDNWVNDHLRYYPSPGIRMPSYNAFDCTCVNHASMTEKQTMAAILALLPLSLTISLWYKFKH